MLKLGLALLVGGVLFLQQSNGFKPCIKVTGVPMSEEFADANPIFHVPLHSGCDNCEAGDSRWTSIGGRTLPKKRCYSLTGSFKEGLSWKEFMVTFKCKYTTLAAGMCEVKGKKPPYLSGSMTTTMTDNSTFVALAGCIFGKENFWLIAATQDLPDHQVQLILDDFHEKGFNTSHEALDRGEVNFMKFEVDKTC